MTALRLFSALLPLIPLHAFSAPPEQPGEVPAKPNIVLILIDDMGWQDTSVPFWDQPTPFNAHFRTPGMERLAAAGVRFTQAYACAVCSPTRTSILTGQNAARHHVTNWTLLPDRDQSGVTDRLRSPLHWRLEGIQPGEVTLPGLLRAAGYRTIHCGKAHWGAQSTPGADPRNLGFDVNIAGHAAGAPGHYHGSENYGNEKPGAYTQPWGVPGLEAYHGSETHLTDALTLEANRAVRGAVRDGKPFFLYLAHYAVHAPIQEHRPHVENYRGSYPGTNLPIPETEARYASMVEGMDASLRAVWKELEELEVAEETLILFTSDNGGLSAHARGLTPRGTGKDTHCWPLKAGKGSAYEGGIRVPYLAAWAAARPGHPLQRRLPIAAGSLCRAPILAEDLFPTLCSIAGAAIPAGYPVDGLDISPWLTDAGAPSPDRPLVFHYPHVWGPQGLGYEPHSSLRSGDWKLIYFYEPRRWELYNLAEDIGEERDLAAAQPEQTRRLARSLVSELERLGAQWPARRDDETPEPPVLP